MDELTLKTTYRKVLGKKARFLRRDGVTPIHLFGHGIESMSLQADTAQLQRLIAQAGLTRPVSFEIENSKCTECILIREVQRDAISKKLLHVDFYQVRQGEKIKVDVPLVLVGEAPAIKSKGGMLSQIISSLSIECLPAKIPSHIDVDLSPLQEIEQAIRVKDIVLDPDITINADPEQLVVKVSEITVEKIEEVVKPAAEVTAEGEAAAGAEGEAAAGAEAKAEGEAAAGEKGKKRSE